jgi:hypothetical protein
MSDAVAARTCSLPEGRSPFVTLFSVSQTMAPYSRVVQRPECLVKG